MLIVTQMEVTKKEESRLFIVRFTHKQRHELKDFIGILEAKLKEMLTTLNLKGTCKVHRISE